MNKICTSIVQSKKLIELGIDVNTADMHYYKNSFGDYIEGLYNSNDLKNGFELKGIEYIPAWSLSAFLSVLPFHIVVDNRVYAFGMVKGFNKNGEPYAIKYAIFNTTFYLHITDFYNNSIDACVEMIMKLNELKLL